MYSKKKKKKKKPSEGNRARALKRRERETTPRVRVESKIRRDAFRGHLLVERRKVRAVLQVPCVRARVRVRASCVMTARAACRARASRARMTT